MEPTTPAKLPIGRWILVLTVVGLVALLLYMYFFVGFGNIISELEKIDLYYYVAAFITVLASTLFFSLTWQSLLDSLAIRIKTHQALVFVYAGSFIDSIVPEPANISGDLIKAYLVSRVTGESSGKATASVLGQKALGIMITTGNLLLGLILLIFNYYLFTGLVIFIVVVLFFLVASLIVLYYVSTNPEVSKRIVYTLINIICFIVRGRWDLTKLQQTADELLNAFHKGVQTLLTKPRTLIKPLLFSILQWACDVFAVFLVFAAIGYPVSADKILIVYGLTGGLQSMGVSFIGVIEVIMSTLYTILSIPLAVSTIATLLSRLLTFYFKLIIAYGAFQYVGLKLLLSQGETKIEEKPPIET